MFRLFAKTLLFVLTLGTFISMPAAFSAVNTSWFDSCSVVPNCLGVNLHVDFRNPTRLEEDFDGIKNAGFKLVRTDMFWQWVEPSKGSYDYRGFDRFVSGARQRGLRSLLILDYTNERFYGPVYEHSGRQGFTSYATAAAKHYKGQSIIWELWNEANTSNFWKPQPNPTHYMALAKSTIPAMRAVDPSLIIVGPGALRKKPPTDSTVHMTETDFVSGTFKYSFGTLFNGVSYHPYRMEAPHDPPETMISDYDMMTGLIAKLSPAIRLPLLNTERGYNSSDLGSAEKQGDYLVRAYLVGLTRNVPLMVWYGWRDEDANGGYGVITQSGAPKPAYGKLQTLVKELSGYRYVSRMASSSTDYILIFSKNLDFKIAAWTTGSAHTVTLYPGKSVLLKQAPAYYAAPKSVIKK